MTDDIGDKTERPQEEHRRSSGRRRGLLIGGPLLLAAGAYLGLYLWQGDRIPDGTTVAGADVGGMNQDEARSAVQARAQDLGAKPVGIRLGDSGNTELVPSNSGLSLDVDGSMGDVGASTVNPITLMSRVFGGEEHEPVVTTDRGKLADAVHRAAGAELTTGSKDGSVSIEDGEVEVVRSRAGEGVDADAVADDIAKGWPGDTTVTAKVEEREPRLSNAEIDRFVKEFANPAVSGPLTVTVGEQSTELSTEDIAELVTIRQKGSKLTATVDSKKASDLLREENPELEAPARDAKVSLGKGKVSTIAGKNGTVLDTKKVGPALLKGLTAQERRMALPTKTDKPDVTEADLKGIDTKSVITEYRSKFPGGVSNEIRTQNMRVALEAINGTVVPAGGQFSLIHTLGGDLTPEKGYGAAPTIQGGKERAAQGGGVSQVSTAMYNAAFFAGVQLDEHTPHSFWIERYPAGREATIWVPQLDNKWTNDTGEPIIVLGKIEGDEVVVTFLGQRKYEVKTSTSDKYNIRQPQTIEDNHPGCLPVPTNIGFDVDVTRTLSKGGKVVRTEKETTSYQAANRVICTHPSAG